MSGYCEGKVAVVTGAGGTLCSAIAKDLARQGAKVVLVGRTREKLEKVARKIEEAQRARCPTPDGGFSARGQQVIAHTPMGRFGEADELLGCVNWLLDDEKSGFVTGITVPVDGGFLSSAGV